MEYRGSNTPKVGRHREQLYFQSILLSFLLKFCRIIIYNLLCIFVLKFDTQKYKALISSILNSNSIKHQDKIIYYDESSFAQAIQSQCCKAGSLRRKMQSCIWEQSLFEVMTAFPRRDILAVVESQRVESCWEYVAGE